MTGKPSQFAKRLINEICPKHPTLVGCCAADMISGMWKEQLPPLVRAAVGRSAKVLDGTVGTSHTSHRSHLNNSEGPKLQTYPSHCGRDKCRAVKIRTITKLILESPQAVKLEGKLLKVKSLSEARRQFVDMSFAWESAICDCCTRSSSWGRQGVHVTRGWNTASLTF